MNKIPPFNYFLVFVTIIILWTFLAFVVFGEQETPVEDTDKLIELLESAELPELVNDDEVVQMATDMIQKYEWFSPVAYMDTSWRYSIGYGTRSREWETITMSEWYARMKIIIRSSYKKIKKDFPDATKYEYTALLSLYYNCHGWYKKVVKYWYKVWFEKWFCELPWYSGLITRRNEERSLLKHQEQ